MGIQTIKEDIKETKTRLQKLEKELLRLQESCAHTFVELENYQRCKKCQKSEPLYY